MWGPVANLWATQMLKKYVESIKLSEIGFFFRHDCQKVEQIHSFRDLVKQIFRKIALVIRSTMGATSGLGNNRQSMIGRQTGDGSRRENRWRLQSEGEVGNA